MTVKIYKNPSPDIFNKDEEHFGAYIAHLAEVSISSSYCTQQFSKFTQKEKNDIPYSIHSKKQKETYLILKFDALAIINAITEFNREDIKQEWATGIQFESSMDGETWKLLKYFKVQNNTTINAWNFDLTEFEESKCQGQYFRQILKGKKQYLSLKQIMLWDRKEKLQRVSI